MPTVQTTTAEQSARCSVVCPTCGDDKQPGELACRRCYRSGPPNGAPALKWSGLSFAAWLEKVRNHNRKPAHA